jgi:hypothetical protein
VALTALGGGQGGGPLATGQSANHSLVIGRPHLDTFEFDLDAFDHFLEFDKTGSLVPGLVDIEQTVAVTNDGAAPLAIGQLKVVPGFGGGPSGAADEFKIVGDGCSNRTLGVLESCFVSIRYVPLTYDVQWPLGYAPAAFLEIPSDSFDGPGFILLDPPANESPAAATESRSAPASSGSAAAVVRPSAPAARRGVKKAVRASCARVRKAKGGVRVSCRLAGQRKGTAVKAWLVRGKRTFASGRTKVGAKGQASLRMKARRRVRRGTYTVVVQTPDGIGYARARVR